MEAIGAKVCAFQPADEVYGDTCKCGYGALAELVCADESALAPKPTTLSFEEAVGVANRPSSPCRASGGIGTFAVQIAKSIGAEVTGVCGARDLDIVRSLGADFVIDYAKEGVANKAEAYDLILAIRGTLPVRDYYRALRPGGAYVMAGGSIFRFILTAFQGSRLFRSGSKTMGRFTYSPTAEDLLLMKGLIEAGKVRSIIDKVYPLSEAAEAFRYLGKGHARGRVVVRVG